MKTLDEAVERVSVFTSMSNKVVVVRKHCPGLENPVEGPGMFNQERLKVREPFRTGEEVLFVDRGSGDHVGLSWLESVFR